MRGLAPRRRTAKRAGWLAAMALGLAIGGGGAAFVSSGAGLAFEETLGLSWLFLVRGPIQPPVDVAVVALDKRSAEALGLPPRPRRWPRAVQAQTIAALDRAGVSAIAVDLILSERTTPAEDAALATAIAEAGRVVLFQQLERRRETLTIGATDLRHGLWSERAHPPIPEFASAAAAAAPFPLPKVGAGVRQFWAFKRAAGDVPTLPAVALQLHALDAYQQWINALEARPGAGDRPGALPRQRPARVAGRGDDGDARAPTAPSPISATPRLRRRRRARRMKRAATRRPKTDPALVAAVAGLYGGPDSHYLNFYGPPGTIPVIPVTRLLKAQDGADGQLDLARKVVFIGVAELDDPGQPDGFYSVFTRADGVDLSGVEIAATAFANMLTGRAIQPASPARAAAVVGGIGLAAGAAAAVLPAMVVVPSAIAGAALYAFGAQVAFNRADLWLPLATPVLLQVPLALFLGVLGQYVLAQRQRRRMTQAISYYLPEKVAADLREGAVTAPGDRGETVYATCLASDLENFTSIAETMTPEAVARYLNAYFAAVAEPIRRHGADVLEFRADGIMCAWTGDDASARRPRQGLRGGPGGDRGRSQLRLGGGAPAAPHPPRHPRRADLRRPCRRRRALRLQHHRRHRQHRLADRRPEQAHRHVAAGVRGRRGAARRLSPPPGRALPPPRQAVAHRRRRGARPPRERAGGRRQPVRPFRRCAHRLPGALLGGSRGRRSRRWCATTRSTGPAPSIFAARARFWRCRPERPTRPSFASMPSEARADRPGSCLGAANRRQKTNDYLKMTR